jgi:YbbR domain-containing protein
MKASGWAGNLASFLLSFTLALVVWVIATQQQDPIITDTFIVAVPIEYSPPPAGMVLVGTVKDTLDQMTIQAPRSSWRDLGKDKFRARVDLSSLDEGLHDVPVHVECADPQVRILQIVPKAVSVRLERLEEKKIKVEPHITNDVPFGYEAGKSTLSPEEVKVSGPSSAVERVKAAVAEVYLGVIKNTVERQVRLKPVDASGRPVSGVQLNPSVITVTVPVKQLAGVRELPVVTRIIGRPAPGYRVTGISVSPQEVKVLGSPKDIKSLPGFVETPPVDVSKATAPIVESLPLSLPQNITVWGTYSVTVRVDISPIEGSMTIQRELIIRGLDVSLEAKPSLNTVTVILSGPISRLNKLRPEEVQVMLDLSGLQPGVYNLHPLPIPPSGVTVDSVIPRVVEVTIRPKPTPTPTGTITTTLTVTPSVTMTPTAVMSPTVRP